MLPLLGALAVSQLLGTRSEPGTCTVKLLADCTGADLGGPIAGLNDAVSRPHHANAGTYSCDHPYSCVAPHFVPRWLRRVPLSAIVGVAR